ncbi:MAG: DNA polymerase III subunit delta' C-terminal domain-containing protein [Candidatus Izemoplasmatales bacterium]
MFLNWDEVKKTQEGVARILTNSISLNRVSHSYIFEGPKGTRKTGVAMLFAKTLLCTNLKDNNPCNECHNCKRVESLTHPNLFIIDPPGKIIKKELISNLIIELSKASLEQGPRVYIVVDADRFNQSSANTLLKTMEEPGQEVYQILITENYNSLLPTIISRAETLHFLPINRSLIKQHLMELNITETLANIVSQYTSDISTAEKLVKDKETEEIYILVTEIFYNFLIKDQSSIISLYQNGKIYNSNESVDIFLNLLTYYQKDILSYKLNVDNSIMFVDQKETIAKLAKKVTKLQAQKYLEEMLELSMKLKYNINLLLAFNKLLMSLERGYKHATQSSSDTV